MTAPNALSALPEPWLSKSTVARQYETSVRTIERWIFDGCPSRLIGGMRRLRLSDVDGYLTDREES